MALQSHRLLQGLLREELTRRRAKNAAYSLRALAKRVGLHSSAVSEILNGKRRVSLKIATRIADRLAMAPDQKATLVAAFSAGAEQNTPKAAKRLQIEADRYQMIADWYHFAILSLTETVGFKIDFSWIARRLCLSPSEVQQALKRLVRCDLLRVEGKGAKPTGVSFTSPDGISVPALKRAHQQNLALAEEALFQRAVDERDFCAVTMAVDPAKLPQAKKKIRQFVAEMETLLEQEPKTEVFKLCVQLFPLTSKDGTK